MNIAALKYNKCQQADLGKSSPFLQKDAKTPPIHPSRCGRRYMKMKFITILLLLLCNFALADIDLVKVDKSEAKMYLYDGTNIVKEYHVAFGGNPKGHKQQEGDQKTPEGVYTLDYKKENSSFYRAMHISYPNEKDIENAKQLGVSPGGFIMVHGQKNYFGWLSASLQLPNYLIGQMVVLL